MLGFIIKKIRNIALKCIHSYDCRQYSKKINDGNKTNYKIGINTNIPYPENVYIGNNTYINGGEIIAKNAKIIIGNNCLISYRVHIRTDSHNYKERNELIRLQGNFQKDIIVGDDCWIGYGVQILPGDL